MQCPKAVPGADPEANGTTVHNRAVQGADLGIDSTIVLNRVVPEADSVDGGGDRAGPQADRVEYGSGNRAGPEAGRVEGASNCGEAGPEADHEERSGRADMDVGDNPRVPGVLDVACWAQDQI